MFVCDSSPDEHGCFGWIDFPFDSLALLDEYIASFFVDEGLFLDFGIAFAHADDGGDLNGLEDPVIVIAFDCAERFDEFFVADAETDSPAGHVVGFAHGGEFDADVLSAGGLHEGWRLVIVEASFAVREVGDDDYVVFFGHLDDRFPEGEIDAHGGGVVWEIEDHHLRFGLEVGDDVFDAFEEGCVVAYRDADDIAASKDDGVGVDLEGGFGDDGGITGTKKGETHV